MSALRRVKAGAFSIEDAHTIEEIQAEPDRYILPVDTLFAEHPTLTVNAVCEKKLRCGNTVKCTAQNGTYRVYSEDGEFLLLGNVRNGELITIKNFFEVSDGK